MQINISSWQIIFTFFPSLLILLTIALVKIFFDVNISLLMRDPSDIAGHSPLYGIISNLGAVGWFATAAICFFSAVILYGYNSKNVFTFSLFSGFLSLYLGIDDFFMFHEYLAPKYLGISQGYIFLGIVVFLLAYLAKFWKLILSMEHKLLLLAIVFLTTSVCVDLLPKSLIVGYGDWIFLYEDGFKFLGIASWFSYFFGIYYQLIRNNL